MNSNLSSSKSKISAVSLCPLPKKRLLSIFMPPILDALPQYPRALLSCCLWYGQSTLFALIALHLCERSCNHVLHLLPERVRSLGRLCVVFSVTPTVSPPAPLLPYPSITAREVPPQSRPSGKVEFVLTYKTTFTILPPRKREFL